MKKTIIFLSICICFFYNCKLQHNSESKKESVHKSIENDEEYVDIIGLL